MVGLVERIMYKKMGNNRDFSDSIKLEVIKNNLKKYNGSICCEICKIKLNSIDECHFDHIYPFAKGGKSSLENCQILCSTCNLSKNDKELQDFVLEEKAKQFLAGGAMDSTQVYNTDSTMQVDEKTGLKESQFTKAEFDLRIKNFIDKHGDIHKVDFSRVYNNLPSVWYVREYYGDLNSLKKAFGIEDLSLNWTRDRIKEVLLDYVDRHGDVFEKDLKKRNGLPSYPCVLKYYPEYQGSFSMFKEKVLGIKNTYKIWTKDEIISAGKAFVEEHGKLNENDLKAKNGLPTSKVIYNHFGNINEFQRVIGAPITKRNAFVTKEEIEKAVEEYFGIKERVVESRKVFLESFPFKSQVIYKRYGSFEDFCSETGIHFLSYRKGSYSKKEIDDAVHNWIFEGNDIPKAKDLTKNGLPSMSSIMKYYESWKEPFVLYKKIYDEANRSKK